MLGTSSAKLDQILFNGMIFEDHKGLGYKGEYSNSKTIFVKPDPIFVFGLPIITKIVISFVATKNKAKPVAIEKRSLACLSRLEK